MKVLLVHNHYQSSSPSGEDVVFEAEKNLLSENGIEVVTYVRRNDGIINFNLFKQANLAFNNIWSKESYKEIMKIIKRVKPDIAHFHNIWYLISPSAYYACKNYSIPVVQTLHNFRFFCLNGLLLRNGKVCTDCIGALPWRGIIFKCFRGSFAYSAALGLVIIFHHLRKTFLKTIDGYIALTEFNKKLFVRAGLPENKIYVKPNFFQDLGNNSKQDENYAIYLGRISEEKGVRILVEAWGKIKRFKLLIIGDGPKRKKCEELALKEKIKNIEFLGFQPRRKVLELIKSASFLIIPSLCYETFGMTIGEAFSAGKPVVGSNLGNIAEIIKHGETGLLFRPRDPDDLAEKIQWMIDNPKERQRMGENAYQEYLEKYTPEKNFKMLMEIYEDVLNKTKK